MNTITRSLEIYRDEGLFELADSLTDFVSSRIRDEWLRYVYKQQYGALAPQPNEILWVDPQHIEYSTSASKMFDEDRTYPRFGILDGDWDTHKYRWRDSRLWSGLCERFEDGNAWEETTYYQFSIERLEAGDPLPYLDGPNTRQHLWEYLDALDALYEDIQTNGYDPSSAIIVHLGRNGEWIVGQGNHRRTIASIVGVDAIPVRIRFRHRKWQDIRRAFYDADSTDEIRHLDEHLHHPDTPEVSHPEVPDVQ
ncbi:hypothetical protein [Natronomonas amylolytica]|uniref:hypothetical protein n=1 Tax=Natronomonas amylolytica TaxID=3108498 RepID=UPI00300B7EE2